jgi:hypothetical protein
MGVANERQSRQTLKNGGERKRRRLRRMTRI